MIVASGASSDDWLALARLIVLSRRGEGSAKDEFEGVLKKTGLTVEAIHEYEKHHTELRRATYKVPHKGYSGTSANYVLHLVQDLGMAPAAAKHATSRPW